MSENIKADQEQQQYDYTNRYDSDAYGDNYRRGSEINKNTLLIALGAIALVLIIVLIIKSCSAGKLKGIKVGNVPIIYVGEKEEISVSTIGRGNRKETIFDFSLKNDSVAVIEDEMQIGSEVNVVIKGKKPGDTTLKINAELGDKHFTETKDIIVCGRLEVEDITDNTITVEKGKKKSLKLGLGDNGKCYAAINFDFDTDGVARVVDDDSIEGLDAGKTTLTITDGGKGRVTYDVVVTDPNAKIFATDIQVSSSSLSICVGDSKELTATISPSNVSDKSVMWSSNKTSVATVSNGRVTGQTVGTAQVTVMTQDGSDKTATVDIQVVKCGESNSSNTTSEVKVKSITLSPSSPTVTVGSTTTVSVGITPTDATNQTVTCKSANTKYFTATSDGKNCIITGVESGSAKLIVTANDGSNVEQNATVNVTSSSSSGGSSGGSSDGGSGSSSCKKITSKSITLSKSSVADDETFTATATWSPSKAKITSISWSLQSGLTKVSQSDSDGKSIITIKANDTHNDGKSHVSYVGLTIYGCNSSDKIVVGTKSVTIGSKNPSVTCNVDNCTKCDTENHCVQCSTAAYYTLSNGKCCKNITGCTSYYPSCLCKSCDTRYYDYSNGSCVKKKTTYNGTCTCYTGTYGGTCKLEYHVNSCSSCCASCNCTVSPYQNDATYLCKRTETVSEMTKSTCAGIYGSNWTGTLTKETKSFSCGTYSTCSELCSAKGYTLNSGTCTK